MQSGAPQNSYQVLTAPHNKCSKNGKSEVLHQLPERGRDMKWANAAGKMVLIDLLDAGLARLQLVENQNAVSVKCS